MTTDQDLPAPRQSAGPSNPMDNIVVRYTTDDDGVWLRCRLDETEWQVPNAAFDPTVLGVVASATVHNLSCVYRWTQFLTGNVWKREVADGLLGRFVDIRLPGGHGGAGYAWKVYEDEHGVGIEFDYGYGFPLHDAEVWWRPATAKERADAEDTRRERL